MNINDVAAGEPLKFSAPTVNAWNAAARRHLASTGGDLPGGGPELSRSLMQFCCSDYCAVGDVVGIPLPTDDFTATHYGDANPGSYDHNNGFVDVVKALTAEMTCGIVIVENDPDVEDSVGLMQVSGIAPAKLPHDQPAGMRFVTGGAYGIEHSWFGRHRMVGRLTSGDDGEFCLVHINCRPEATVKYLCQIQDSTVLTADRRWTYGFAQVKQSGGTSFPLVDGGLTHEIAGVAVNTVEAPNAGTDQVGSGEDFSDEPLASNPSVVLKPIRFLPVLEVSCGPDGNTFQGWNISQGACGE